MLSLATACPALALAALASLGGPDPDPLSPGPAAARTLPCQLVEQWTWDGELRDPTYSAPCCSSPVLAQLTDDDGNGRVDAADVPDVLFLHFGPASDTRITAVDGRDGSPLLDLPAIVRLSGLATADLDGDGSVEIVAVEKASDALIAFERDGRIKWRGETPPGGLRDWHVLGIADLDQDGSPEIYSGPNVFDASGRLRWQGTATGGSAYFDGFVSNAVDLDPQSPGLELLAGPTLYSASGAVLWRAPGLADGWTGVGDVDGDGDPEVVLAGESEVDLLDARGQLLSVYPFPGQVVSLPALADIDGDGRAEVVVTQDFEMRALGFDGRDLVTEWTLPIQDDSRLGSVAAFDLDGDGAAELLHHDETALRIIDGRSGAVLLAQPLPTGTGFETPVVADIDGDCETEILVNSFGFLGADLVRAYACDGARPARPQWNQLSYHVTNIDERGAVPRVEASPWGAGAAWLGQAAGGVSAAAGADADVCAGTGLTLDGSASVAPGCVGGPSYEWRRGPTVVQPSSPDPRFSPPTARAGTTDYTLIVRCAEGPACEASDLVTVTVRDCPLAVRFEQVRARRLAAAAAAPVEVAWRTALEEDSNYFQVERAAAASGPYAVVGPVEARGAGSDYLLVDADPAGAVWYRVVEYTSDGRGDASPAVAAEVTPLPAGGPVRTRWRGARGR